MTKNDAYLKKVILKQSDIKSGSTCVKGFKLDGRKTEVINPLEEYNSKVVSEKGASRKDALSDDAYLVENERQHTEGNLPDSN